ncbi:hypothetical protein NMG60_11009591 [Bertholletia excelsa]
MDAAHLKRSDHGGVAVKKEKRYESDRNEEEIVLKDNQLENVKVEMGEVREENQRLKLSLNRIMKEYHILQKQFYECVGQETKEAHKKNKELDQHVSLSLGIATSSTSSDQKKEEKDGSLKDDRNDPEGLRLGLDCKFEVSDAATSENSRKLSPENSWEELKDEAVNQKGVKNVRSGGDEDLQQNQGKRARVSVRARCDTPTMNDGCQWRKYGQKIAKGNPCPRAYYRCSITSSCPVRKQVQRYAHDMSILITTYEGTHNHPLPISATAMASATSAAASMLMSGSSTSGTGLDPSTGITSSATIDLGGLNIYLPNSSYSTSHSHQTITLDLASSPPSSSINKITSNHFSNPKHNFSSLESNPLPMHWNSGPFNYGSQPHKDQVGTLNFARQDQETVYQSFFKSNRNPNPDPQQQSADSVAAAAKAITSDPSFQYVLATALKSIIGTDSGGGGGSSDGGGGCGLLGTVFPQPLLPFSTSKSKSTSPRDKEHTV